DQNNCLSVDTFDIHDNNALSASVSETDVSCFDYCDGEITVNVVGGIPNINSTGNSIYNYLWNDTLFQTTQTAIGLCVNNNSLSTIYECVVTDMQGCAITLSGTIEQPTQVSVTASIVEEILCFNGSNGQLNSSGSGGVAPYHYLWNDNTNTAANNGVPAGNYVITLTDTRGCTAADFITLNEPTELSLTISDTSVTCFGFNDGIIVAAAGGGTPFLGIPPEYLYTVINETGASVYSETIPVGLAENLLPGIYTIIAEDMNGCTIESGTIYISEPGDSLSITFNTVDASCLQNNGSASIEAYGGTPLYQYNWDNNITTANNTSLEAGYYPVTVIDSRGCEIRDSAFVKGTHNVFADSLSEITFNICLGDSVFITVNEAPLNTYVWENGSTITDRWVYPTDYINIYTLTITDLICPSAYEVVATVNVDFIDPMPASNPGVEYGNFPVILAGENIDLYSENNTCVEYTWEWTNETISNNNGLIIIEELQKTDLYYLYVKDSEGCLGYDSIYVVVGVKPYDAITPNNDGFNDTWTPLDIESYENALVQVFNRWGGLVFESKGGENYQAWDGTNGGKELAVGTYYYIIDLDTGDEPQTGPITIVR
ncbi:MAG: gliding motility-associated C-terminal domain-containing protein, partial [Bacteroidota bacterium]|nr:gliding motility-associated C-terminal domain-containing protein [Bacteroidota bacterium]